MAGIAGRIAPRLAWIATAAVGVTAAALTLTGAELVPAHADNQPVIQTTTATLSPADLASQRQASLSRGTSAIREGQLTAQAEEHASARADDAALITEENKRLKELSTFLWPTAGGVSSGWGQRKHPILGYTRLHGGADIGGACGAPIYAAQSGEVTKVGSGGGSGNNIRIDHGVIEGTRVETAYLHMTKYVVNTGDRVTKGDLVGYVGSTGLSTACHLHLALYKNGNNSDPMEYVKR